MPSLRRVSDGAGDCGSMSDAIYAGKSLFNPARGDVMGHRPKVGCCMRVGSHFARTMQHQDYWTTTPVTEILEETETYVRFRTRNSEYEWRS